MSPKSFLRCHICRQRPRTFKWSTMWFAQCPLRPVRGWRRCRLAKSECLTMSLWTKRQLRANWNIWVQMHARAYRTPLEV